MRMARKWVFLVCLLSWLKIPLLTAAQEGIFLKEDEAPKAVFPDAMVFDRQVVRSTEDLREKIRQRMGKTKTSLWEASYITYVARQGNRILGYAVIVEEIGKHRPITFVVGVGSDRKIRDVALMVYREAYGGEVKDQRFLRQYRGKNENDPMLPFRDIQNISGATMSVEAIGRGTKKALAIVDAIYFGEGTVK